MGRGKQGKGKGRDFQQQEAPMGPWALGLAAASAKDGAAPTSTVAVGAKVFAWADGTHTMADCASEGPVVAIAQCGSWVVTAHESKALVAWSIGGGDDGKVLVRVCSASSARKTVSVAILPKPDGKEGECILYAGEKTGVVYAYTLPGLEAMHESDGAFLGHYTVLTNVLAHGANRVVTTDVEGKIRVSSHPDVYETISYGLGHGHAVAAVAVLDASRIASSSEDGTIRVWEVETGKEIARAPLEGGESAASLLAAHQNGQDNKNKTTIAAVRPAPTNQLAAFQFDSESNKLVAGAHMTVEPAPTSLVFDNEGRLFLYGSKPLCRVFTLSDNALEWTEIKGDALPAVAAAVNAQQDALLDGKTIDAKGTRAVWEQAAASMKAASQLDWDDMGNEEDK